MAAASPEIRLRCLELACARHEDEADALAAAERFAGWVVGDRPPLRKNDVAVDLDRNTITVCGEPIRLRPSEAEVAHILHERFGKVVRQETLLNGLYGAGSDKEPDGKIVDVYICGLRKKLPGELVVETVWGRGYCMKPAPDKPAASASEHPASSPAGAEGPSEDTSALSDDAGTPRGDERDGGAPHQHEISDTAQPAGRSKGGPAPALEGGDRHAEGRKSAASALKASTSDETSEDTRPGAGAAGDTAPGLSERQELVLWALAKLQAEGRPPTQQDIALRSGVGRGGISLHLQALERKGYLRLEKDGNRRRYVVLREPDGSPVDTGEGATDSDPAPAASTERPATDNRRSRTRPFRRFTGKPDLDPENVNGLAEDHEAAVEGRTLFPSTVVDPESSPGLLVSGGNSRKLGDRVVKGPWAGMPIYQLTLEERATCPRDCDHWHTCLVPGTRVLTTDLRWVNVETLQAGDEIVGFDEEPAEGGRRQTREAVVEAIRRDSRPCYRIVTDQGEVTASEEHLFIVRRASGLARRAGYDWQRADSLRPGDEIQFLAKPWEQDLSYGAGRIRGFVEGEGYLGTYGNGGFPKSRLGWSQLPSPLLDEINEMAEARGFTVNTTDRISGAADSIVRHADIMGGWRELLRFMGVIRPSRLMERVPDLLFGRVLDGRCSNPAKVLAVEFVGNREVVPVATSTRTLIAEGFLAHNCYGNTMPFSRRHKHGPSLTSRLWKELERLQKHHPKGFVVRLHVLGDFYSLGYVDFWRRLLDTYESLHVFGFTHWRPETEIGAEIERLGDERWDRFAIRFSSEEARPGGVTTLWRKPEDLEVPEGTIVCPAQTGATDCCGTCGLCWHPTAKDKTIAFVAHGRVGARPKEKAAETRAKNAPAAKPWPAEQKTEEPSEPTAADFAKGVKRKCAACRAEFKALNSHDDLCSECRGKTRRVPGYGDGPLPHWDDLPLKEKWSQAAEAGKRRKKHAGAA